ncbi:MAG: polysaccharide biosynthesis/export family protein [Planctomycetota bacterium]|nr:polysaccharide biosynthesis/export family protein [Planctomycetota bacterium]
MQNKQTRPIDQTDRVPSALRRPLLVAIVFALLAAVVTVIAGPAGILTSIDETRSAPNAEQEYARLYEHVWEGLPNVQLCQAVAPTGNSSSAPPAYRAQLESVYPKPVPLQTASTQRNHTPTVANGHGTAMPPAAYASHPGGFDGDFPGPMPVAPPMCAVDCAAAGCANGGCGNAGCGSGGCGGGKIGWDQAQLMDFGPYGAGEYVGNARLAHVMTYRLRVDDQLECLYRLTREETAEPYQINVGDEVQVESFTDPNLNRNLIVQPDGTITLRLLGQVKATRHTVQELRKKVDELYSKYYKNPAITVTPLKVNTRLLDLVNTVDNRAGIVGGQGVKVRITPEGTITLPAIGTVPAQGLTLEELKTEVDQRYAATIKGIEVTPVLAQRAPRFCYVLGEVKTPGRFELQGPTTVMQAIALAGSWNVGANLRQVVIFRRGEDWRLLATMVNLQGALMFANQPCPAGEIWLNDSDVVILPKGKILLADDFIDLVFTRGIYGVLPVTGTYAFGPSAVVD